MNKLVVVMFPDAATIHQATGVLAKLRAEGSIKLYASTIVAKDPSGKLSLQELTKEGLDGTAVGALIGGLAGLALGPLAATIGVAGGALIGNSADRIDQRAEAEFVERFSGEFGPRKDGCRGRDCRRRCDRLRGDDESDWRYRGPPVADWIARHFSERRHNVIPLQNK
jgi:hypothetical protein